MTQLTKDEEIRLVAALNDLLQLDHDAVGAYTVAINTLRNEAYRATLAQYRGDHERHIRELTELIRVHGGVPVQTPHLPTGVFKMAMQGIGAAGGDRAVLLAFRTNERQVRDKYRRACDSAAAYPEDVAAVVRRAAEDETRHYDWAAQVLEDMGVRADSTLGRAAALAEAGNARVNDAMERVGRWEMRGAERVRRGVSDAARTASRHPVASVAVAAWVGMVAANFFGRSRR